MGGKFSLPFGRADFFGADERAFLPAALEILESPPSPVGRATAFAIALVAFAGLGWATIGKIDIVAVANGKIVSHLRTRVVQPFETASVVAVLVRPGQPVRAGDALVELDKTAALAERDRAEKDLTAALLDQVRLTAFLDRSTTSTAEGVELRLRAFSDTAAEAPFESVTAAGPLEIQRARAQLIAQIAGRATQLANLSQEKAQRKAERQAQQQTGTKIEQSLPMVAERADIRTKAAEVGNASMLSKLESQQLLVETQAEIQIGRSKVAALDAAIEGIDQKIAALEAEIRTNALSDLSKAQERIRAGRETFAKAQRRVELQTLRAPVDGTVQQLHVVSAGSVVTPAQQLLSIAPIDDSIEVEAVLENHDVGFVEAGQPVEIKIDAFPFTRYGLMKGTVLSVDRDAEAAPVSQKSVHGSQRPADATDSVELSERLRYTVHIGFTPGTLNIDGRPAALLPGMSVKAEILTGKRRIIDFLLAPLRELTHDALRER